LYYSPVLVCCGNRFWKGFKKYNINITVQERCTDGGGPGYRKIQQSRFL